MRGTWTFNRDTREWQKGEHPSPHADVYPARLPGHHLTLIWSGERGKYESSSTAECTCGWRESASNQRECRWEYRVHLAHVHARQAAAS